MHFIPPLPSGPVIALGRRLVRLILRLRGIVSVECPEEDLDRLRSLRDARTVIVPNHPTPCDPLVLFHLSSLVGQRFYFAANRESFGYAHGLWGSLLRRVGAYSIVRGAADLPAIRFMRELLTRPGAKVVLFPEGEVYSRFEEPLPFHPGVAQVAFWAQEDLAESGQPAPIQLLPVALRYRLTPDTRVRLRSAVDRLWLSATGQFGPLRDDEWVRLSLLAGRLADGLDASGVGARLRCAQGSASGRLQQRVSGWADSVLAGTAASLEVALPHEPLHNQVRFLINAAHRDMGARTPGQDHRQLLRRLQRVINWVALAEGLSLSPPSPERLLDVIQRLEIEVFGRLCTVGKRRCFVRIGEPLHVRSFLDQYHVEKRAAAQMLTGKLQAAVQGCLDTMGETGS